MSIKSLIGQTLIRIEGAEKNSETIRFYTQDGRQFVMLHYQDCCESVSVEEVIGDIDDLIGTPVLEAYEATSKDDLTQEARNALSEEIIAARVADTLLGIEKESDGSETWTFYRVVTIRGSVTFRWYGTSNGYYSESVNFTEEHT